MKNLKETFVTKTLETGKHIAAIALLGTLTTACVNSPLPSGTKALVHNWEDRDTALASRNAITDNSEDAFHTGDFIFSNVLKKNPELADNPSQPLVVKACENNACYYAVVFPDDYSINEWGLIDGAVSLTGLSTAMYHQVKELPADQVKARLDELTDLVVSKNEEGTYANFLALDIRRVRDDRNALADESLADEAAQQVAQGGEPKLMSLINAQAKKTSELTASREFVFSDSWDLTVDIDISARTSASSYLMICSDFERKGSGYKVAYNNCALKTDLVNGRFESTLRMTGTTDELLVTIMSLENPEIMEHTLWERNASQSTLRVR